MNPFFIDWAITNKCNLNCVHCTGMMGSELKTERALSLVDEIRELEPEWVIVEGGEPFLRNDIFRILEKMNLNNLKTYVITNALLIKKEIANNLRNFNALKILASFDGADKKIYEEIKIGAKWEIFIKNLEILKNAEVLYGFTVVLSKRNKNQMENFIKWGEKFKIKSIVFIPLEPFEPLSEYYKLSLNPVEYIDVMDRIIEINNSSNIEIFFDEPFFNVYLSLKSKTENNRIESGIIVENRKGCIAGEYIYIQTNGDVHPCMFSEQKWIIGNINKTSLKELWKRMREDKELLLAKDRNSRKGKCKKCEFFEFCFGCLARIKRIKGDIFQSDFLCPIPYLRNRNGG